jgi:hypothetical protein
MTPSEDILAGIQTAGDAVKAAGLNWQPSDLHSVRVSATALSACIPILRASVESISKSQALPASQIRKAAQTLRDDTAALELMVDAAAAFVRSSGVVAAGTYSRDGVTRLDNSSSAESYTG